VLDNEADLLDGVSDIEGNEIAVSTYTAFEIDKMVELAYVTGAVVDLLSLLGKTLLLTTARFKRLLDMIKAYRLFISQPPRRFIIGRLNHLTVQPGQGGCHQVIPGLLIASLSQWFQENKVA
jgi:hypothetical protein